MKARRSPLQRLASSHNRLHYKLQCRVIGGLYEIAEAKTLTSETRARLEEVHDAVARLKDSMRYRNDTGVRSL